jgi:hypothetical protein
MTSPDNGRRGDLVHRAEAFGERVGRIFAEVPRRLRGDGDRDPDTTVTAEDGEQFRRADALVTRAQHATSAYAAVVGTRLRRFAARLREEAEDIAAEAKYVRAGRSSEEAETEGESTAARNGAA